MKKRVVALFLIAVMVMSMTACGSSPKSVDDEINQLTSFDVKQADMDITLSKDSESYTGKIIAVNMDDKNAALEIQYKKESGDYTPVTTMFVSDSAIYINATQLLDFVITLYPSYSMLKSYISLSNDYVMITQAELLQFMSSVGADTGSIDLSAAKNSTVNLKEVNKVYFNILKDASEKSGTSFLTFKDKALNIEITPDNIDKILTALADMDFAKYFDQLNNDSLSANKDQYTKSIKEAIQNLQSEIKSNNMKVNLTTTMKTEGNSGDKKAVVNMNGKFADDEQTINTVMNMTYSEKATKTYSLPANAAPLSELMSKLSKLGLQY